MPECRIGSGVGGRFVIRSAAVWVMSGGFAVGETCRLPVKKERISDNKVLELIEAFLKQGVMENGVETEPEKGSPQGGLISPLLANIYLYHASGGLRDRKIKISNWKSSIDNRSSRSAGWRVGM